MAESVIPTRDKHNRGLGTERVDVSTYVSKRGRHGVQINMHRDLAVRIAVDRHGPEAEFMLDVLCELIERQEAGKADGV